MQVQMDWMDVVEVIHQRHLQLDFDWLQSQFGRGALVQQDQDPSHHHREPDAGPVWV